METVIGSRFGTRLLPAPDIDQNGRKFKEMKKPNDIIMDMLQHQKEGSILTVDSMEDIKQIDNFYALAYEKGVRFQTIREPEYSRQISDNLFELKKKEQERIDSEISYITGMSHGIELANDQKDKADEFAMSIKEVVDDIRKDGRKSLGQIAKELNERGVTTRKGFEFQRNTVRNLLNRYQKLGLK